VTTPLLIGTDGALKMSKSVGNYIGLDDDPADMYGKVMSIPDSLIINYYTLLTDAPTDEIEQIERGIADRSVNPMEAKKRLAREIVTLLNGAEAAAGAQAEFERVFQRREEPEQATEVSWSTLTANDFTNADGELILWKFVADQAGISNSEARRMVTQGGVEVDGERVTAVAVKVGSGSLIKVGRHRFARIVD
jgi:tyrosyl-tRNA synthetase